MLSIVFVMIIIVVDMFIIIIIIIDSIVVMIIIARPGPRARAAAARIRPAMVTQP